MSNTNGFLRDTALRRPYALGTNTKNLLMQIQTTLQLHLSILGMAKTILRQRQARARNRPHVGIADQGQNGVIKGGGRDFDPPLLGRRGMGGQDLGQQLALPSHYEVLVFQRVIASFLNEPRDVGVVQKKFVEPGDLRKDLQVGKVLGGEIYLSAFRCTARVAKVVPQLPVPGISPDQICRIGLEEILQGKPTLVRSEIPGGFGGNLEKRVSRHAGHVVLDLRDQRRDEIESLM